MSIEMREALRYSCWRVRAALRKSVVDNDFAEMHRALLLAGAVMYQLADYGRLEGYIDYVLKTAAVVEALNHDDESVEDVPDCWLRQVGVGEYNAVN